MKNNTNNQNLISIIIPVFKTEKYLDKCIKSIINQTYKNIEIILVDDESPDNCPKMCDKWAKKDNRIKVYHKKNGGVSSARNFGLKNASGKFVQFVDSDDYVEDSYCEKLLQEMINKKVDYVVSGLKLDYGNTCTFTSVKEDIFINQPTLNLEKIFEIQKSTILNSSCAKIFKKDILGNQIFNEQNAFGEDLMFSFDYLVKCKSILILKDSLYVCNKKNENSITNSFTLNLAKMRAFSHNYIAELYLKFGKTKLANFINAQALSSFIYYLTETAKLNKVKFFKDVKIIRQNETFVKTYKHNSLGFKSKIFVLLIKLKLYNVLYSIIKIDLRRKNGK